MSVTYQVGQVWCWDDRYHCMLIRYVSYNWEKRHEVWDVLDLDTHEAGRVCVGLLHNTEASGDGAKWERIT